MGIIGKIGDILKSVLRIGNIVVPVLRALRPVVHEIDVAFEEIDEQIANGGVEADDFFDRNIGTIYQMREFFADLSEFTKEGMYACDKIVQYSQVDTPDTIAPEEATELARAIDRMRQRIQDLLTNSEGLEEAAASMK
ncbi:MAG TPA: hypothetical protein DC063_10065 [Arenimonas sp.]|nr:hypothetical protein [Candidatus Rokubacteria bacterium]HBD20379.1 hypothetical protein [Arenimonas sp.]